MKNTRLISVVGLERGDFPYFLSRIFEEKRFRILVIDNSCSHDLFLALQSECKSDYVERGRTVFMRDKTVSPEDAGALKKFDIVIIYHGYHPDYDLIDMSHKLVCITDYLPGTIRNIGGNIDMEYINSFNKENFYLVYLDKPSEKVSEQVIRRELALSDVENESFVYYDEGCYNAYISLCYNGTHSLKGLSGEYRNALKAIYAAIAGEEKRNKKNREKGAEE